MTARSSRSRRRRTTLVSSTWSIPCASTACCPTIPAVRGDVDANGTVGITDFLALLAAWGPCGCACPADLDENGVVDIVDFLILLANWGPCP